MKKLTVTVAGLILVGLGLRLTADADQSRAQRGLAPAKTSAPSAMSDDLSAEARSANAQPRSAKAEMAVSHTTGTLSLESQTAIVKQYCVTCHSDRGKAGGLTLAAFDASRAVDNAQTTEKMIHKLRLGMMPPAGAKRPDEATLTALASALEGQVDQAAAASPNPGWRPFQRLNRAEYARAVQDLLALDMDVTAFLPPDTISSGFDNVADAQGFSPTLMQGYLRAASKISSLAVGDPTAAPGESTYKVPRTASQMRHVEGAPLGTRGGLSVVNVFPADGEYTFRIQLHSIPTGQLFGSTTEGEQIEVSINGERAALLTISTRMSESDPNGMNLTTPRIYVKAGPQRVSAAFVQRFDGPVDDIIAPIEHTLADTQIGSGFGITALAHVREFAVTGPYSVTGVSETPSRHKIFTCRPTTAVEESTCAGQIVRSLTEQAYRGPVSPQELEGLMRFYEQGRKGADFEAGIRLALQAILASPRFVFRLEQGPGTLRAGQNYRLGDRELASRLSFFIWGAAPDAELLEAASQGTLKTPAVLEKQVRRMLADPKSEALSTRFASQWFRLQDLEKINPDALLYPQYDATLGEALKRETELFFDSLVREDRSLLDLLTADYTFVNERVAKHYGIPNVVGSDFRRVQLADPNRRGILGQGSILTMTSIADRTSPVLRGKWVMEVLLASPPPPPPPNVPLLEETKSEHGMKLLSVRERMEEHRKNPACTSCHKVIDPLGLALENFDVTGAWRIRDNGVPVDPAGVLYDGTKMASPVDLRAALMKHSDAVIKSFTESLMTYAIGRRVEFYDMPTIREIARTAGRNDNRISSFVLGVVKSPAFQMSRAEAIETTVAEK
jgi:mono/diheme cytochrome c family protein